jgi:pyruvate dehydrogenase E2 component (dihydrolipoamide acetyltransferase)
MIREIFMPALSSTMTQGKIVNWVKSLGDKVEKGETVVVVESDKADMDVESFYQGYLANILFPAGEEAPVGTTIALLAETEAEIELAKKQGKSAQSVTIETPTSQAEVAAPVAATVAIPVTVPTPVVTPPGNGNGRIVASPRARKLARELAVDLNTLRGSGPHGRIVAEDVERAVGRVTQPAVVSTPALAAPAPAVKTTSIPTAPAVTPGEIVPLNTLQKAVVQNMVASLQVPVFHVGYTITTDALDKLYKQVKSKGVTMTALLAKAVALTLQKHPVVNARYTEQGTQYNGEINVAIAVAMSDGGLITPVLQNADKMDIYSLSRTWKDLVERSRVKQLQPQEYNSGTFTLSNLGMFGVDRFDAILPPGQGAILAIGSSRPQVVATSDGMIGVRSQMGVNITCDHRIIYGTDAAAFLQDLAELIENNPQSMTM